VRLKIFSLEKKKYRKAESLLILLFLLKCYTLEIVRAAFAYIPLFFSGAVAIGIPLIKVQLD
jgi:hypothetical protein